MLHPYTPLTLAGCLMVAVLIADSWHVSAAVLGLSVLIGVVLPRKGTVSKPLLAALALTFPASISFCLMYGLFGSWATAGVLSIRFAALVFSGLLIGSACSSDALMRVLQLKLPAPLVYVIGSVLRLLPLARARVETIRMIQRSRGVELKGISGRLRLGIPVVVGLIQDAANRSRPLARSGIMQPGPRTLLNEVPDSAGQRLLRWALIVALVGGIIARVVWG